jgi:hypothetical protein
VTRAGCIRRLALWAPLAALVVLASRVLVYALVPQPTLVSLKLQQSAGGPRLVVVAVVVLGLGAAAAAAFVGLAVIAVKERHALAGVSYPSPRLSLGRLLVQAVLLWLTTSVVFALVESTIHWRAGLGFHGLDCLLGPVHRDAIPILAALSLAAAAAVAGAAHILGWLGRVLPLLLEPTRPSSGQASCTPAAYPRALPRLRPTGEAWPRAPPGLPL